MKKIINLLIAFSLVFAFSCKTREKQVQKSETQTEIKLVTLKSQRKPTYFSRWMNFDNISY